MDAGDEAYGADGLQRVGRRVADYVRHHRWGREPEIYRRRDIAGGNNLSLWVVGERVREWRAGCAYLGASYENFTGDRRLRERVGGADSDLDGDVEHGRVRGSRHVERCDVGPCRDAP